MGIWSNLTARFETTPEQSSPALDCLPLDGRVSPARLRKLIAKGLTAELGPDQFPARYPETLEVHSHSRELPDLIFALCLEQGRQKGLRDLPLLSLYLTNALIPTAQDMVPTQKGPSLDSLFVQTEQEPPLFMLEVMEQAVRSHFGTALFEEMRQYYSHFTNWSEMNAKDLGALLANISRLLAELLRPFCHHHDPAIRARAVELIPHLLPDFYVQASFCRELTALYSMSQATGEQLVDHTRAIGQQALEEYLRDDELAPEHRSLFSNDTIALYSLLNRLPLVSSVVTDDNLRTTTFEQARTAIPILVRIVPLVRTEYEQRLTDQKEPGKPTFQEAVRLYLDGELPTLYADILDQSVISCLHDHASELLTGSLYPKPNEQGERLAELLRPEVACLPEQDPAEAILSAQILKRFLAKVHLLPNDLILEPDLLTAALTLAVPAPHPFDPEQSEVEIDNLGQALELLDERTSSLTHFSMRIERHLADLSEFFWPYLAVLARDAQSRVSLEINHTAVDVETSFAAVLVAERLLRCPRHFKAFCTAADRTDASYNQPARILARIDRLLADSWDNTRDLPEVFPGLITPVSLIGLDCGVLRLRTGEQFQRYFDRHWRRSIQDRIGRHVFSDVFLDELGLRWFEDLDPRLPQLQLPDRENTIWEYWQADYRLQAEHPRPPLAEALAQFEQPALARQPFWRALAQAWGSFVESRLPGLMATGEHLTRSQIQAIREQFKHFFTLHLPLAQRHSSRAAMFIQRRSATT